MRKTPKSLRLQLGLFGRTNIGKSTFLNMVAGQDVSITSSIAGTTTDVVEKSMELLPVGPVVFLDTAGVDDKSELSSLRLAKTRKIFDRADIIILLVEPNLWSDFEREVVLEAEKRNTSLIIVINKVDQKKPKEEFLKKIKKYTNFYLLVSSIDVKNRDRYVNLLKSYLIKCCPDDFINPPSLVGDLLPEGGLAVLIVPIDLEAPKGRIILPQVQTIRDCLDNKQMALVVKESEYVSSLSKLNNNPDLVICDSQVVSFMVKNSPLDVNCTTFSIVFSRNKGELAEEVKAVTVIDRLENGDKVLIAEACSHHPIEDDIGRIKIPKWLRQYTKKDIKIDSCAGRDYPDNLSKYKLVVHCGGCMITRREMLFRIQKAKEQKVPLTNYGLAISHLQGVLDRVLSPFPEAQKIYQEEKVEG
ncbi:MAG: [FeFe] hydrogenase H-cluster maturation GTPase HydF [Candidatus Omnitrophica bacterium]|nr:[FeFe] hydrogenase H-cluster maturation GTPase HydF [Candidatus Omnitrophota bacterium]MCF7888360.1 [FeFe] hydrogenase H-cluster maturation GTPase HydF [Candidatus Omnitrophota bacterium]